MIDQVTIPAANTTAVWQAPSYVTVLEITDTDPDGFTVTFKRLGQTMIEFKLDEPTGEPVVVHFTWK
jgi:hypothetical protein